MTEQQYIHIPFPTHPGDKDLPTSNIQFKLPSGKIAGIYGVPIQGEKTIDNILALLKIWKPTIVIPDKNGASIEVVDNNSGYGSEFWEKLTEQTLSERT